MREVNARRLLCSMLGLYPASFRDAVGDDLVATAMHRWFDAKQRSPRTGELRFWLTEGLRFGVDGLLERLHSLPVVLDELNHAWRSVRRTPRHHALAVITLALGIGGTTAIFTVADAVIFRPLPYPGADALYLVHARFGGIELSSNSLPNLRNLQETVTGMSWLAGAHDTSPALVDEQQEPERVSVLDVTEAYLPGLNAKVQLGRMFDRADHAAGAAAVAIVSDGLWRRRWGGDAGALGRTIWLDGIAYTVIGVMHSSFRDPEPIESGALTGIWTTAGALDRAHAHFHRDNFAFRVLGRLTDRASVETVRMQLSAAGARLSAAYPDVNRMRDDDLGFVLHPLRELTVGSARASVLLLLGAVTMLLLLSCANVANLYLAHGITRTSELTVRSALGATRSRLALQLFGESLCTAILAGALGAGLAALGVRAFLAYAPAGIPRLHEITLDQHALGFILVVTLFTAVFFGSVPALKGSGLASALAGTRVTASQRTHRLQAALVGFAVAASLVLVTGSALLLNSFRHLVRVDPGFDGADVIAVELRPPAAAETHAEELLFYRTVMERTQALPGVAQAALMHTIPGVRNGAWSQIVTAKAAASADRPTRSVAPALGQNPGSDFVRINPVYGPLFQALDIPLLAGAAFAGDPSTGEPLVVILNEAAAQRFFPDVVSPIGEHIALGVRGSDIPMREVVGIVGNVHQSGVAQPAEPQIYLPYGQRDINRMTLVIEMKAGARLPVSVLRQMVAGIAPEVPVDRVDALATRYAATAQQLQFLTFLLSVFAALSLALAVVGTYATASHALSRRLRELAIRMALGAPTRNISRLVFARSLLIAGGGIAAGLLLTLALTRFLESYVYGITTRDPLTFAAAAVLLASSVILASLSPALRAARVDPNQVLRSD